MLDCADCRLQTQWRPCYVKMETPWMARYMNCRICASHRIPNTMLMLSSIAQRPTTMTCLFALSSSALLRLSSSLIYFIYSMKTRCLKIDLMRIWFCAELTWHKLNDFTISNNEREMIWEENVQPTNQMWATHFHESFRMDQLEPKGSRCANKLP